jgi:hypothetical protein
LQHDQSLGAGDDAEFAACDQFVDHAAHAGVIGGIVVENDARICG